MDSFIKDDALFRPGYVEPYEGESISHYLGRWRREELTVSHLLGHWEEWLV